jgi:glycosyltransferase involved in cell wall biosynthesis
MLRSSIGVFGAEQVILELARGLRKADIEPIIGVLENSSEFCRELAQKAQDLGLRAQIFPCRFPFDLATVVKIRKFIHENQVNLIHSHGYKSDFYALVGFHDRHIRRMATCHPWLETGISWRARFYTYLDKRLLKKFSQIVAISEEIKQEVLQAGIAPDKINLIENGIDLQRFSRPAAVSRRRELSIPEKGLVIGTVGRLSPEKGHAVLLQAAKLIFESYPDLYILIVGDGPERGKLEMISRETGIARRVIFTGVRDDIEEMLSLMDIFVLPSHSEGLPMALLEAMAAGKPLAASGIGAISRLIDHRRSGLLVPPGDPQSLAEALKELIDNPSTALTYAAAAREAVRQRYSAEHMTRAYLKVYLKLLY